MGEEAKQEAAEEKKESKPPSPCVLFVDLHCIGCAKKIKKSIMKMRGVERVVIDMAKNQVTITGIVEPEAICNIISKKTKKIVQIMSPLPEPEGEPTPEVVTSQAIEPVTTVELNLNMHCEACAEHLKRKILKMRGVQKTEAELSTGKVIVTGTMDANKLVDYVHRRTRKQVKIVPRPEPESLAETEEEKKEFENPEAEQVKPQEEKEEKEEKNEEEKPVEEPKKEEGGNDGNNESKEEKGVEEEEEEEAKKEVVGDENGVVVNVDDESMKKMMYSYYYQPLYVIEPPPQLFSDENPNACCIS